MKILGKIKGQAKGGEILQRAVKLNTDSQISFVKAIHGSNTGFITLANKNPEWSEWHYKIDSVEDEIQSRLLDEKKKENLYMSMNSFFIPKRGVSRVRELNSFYIDLDYYNTDLDKDYILKELEEKYFGQAETGIPQPHYVVDSGRGLYLIWLIENAPGGIRAVLSLWDDIIRDFYNKLKVFGADFNALDSSRVLRLPGSINTKSGKVVEIIKENHIPRYRLIDVKNGYISDNKTNSKDIESKSKIRFIHRERSLYLTRINDLRTIIKLRNGDLKGYREFILFLNRHWIYRLEKDKDKAIESILNLNELFKEPLPKNEMISDTKSSEEGLYNYKNSTLIEMLGITLEEQEHMENIIGTQEKSRRKKIRNKRLYEEKRKASGKLSRKEKNETIRAKIKDLRDKGLTNKEIAEHPSVQLKLKTLENHITNMRNSGLLE